MSQRYTTYSNYSITLAVLKAGIKQLAI